MQIFRRISLYLTDCTTLLVFWPFRRETQVHNDPKYGIFQNWLEIGRKWKRMNQMYTAPFWGVFREVFGVRS